MSGGHFPLTTTHVTVNWRKILQNAQLSYTQHHSFRSVVSVTLSPPMFVLHVLLPLCDGYRYS